MSGEESEEKYNEQNKTTKIKIRESCSILPEKKNKEGERISETIDQQSCKNYEVSYPKRRKGKQARRTKRYAIV